MVIRVDPFLMIVISLVIGLVAGVVGGLAGIGGSIIMLPALGVLFGYQTEDKAEQHLYQAAAMCVNVVVAWAASTRHKKAGVDDPGIRRNLLPGMILGIIGGVLISDQIDGVWLKYGLVVFLWVYCIYNTVTAILGRKHAEHPKGPAAFEMTPAATTKVRVIGGLTGLPSGMLGIGGGIVMIPLMQVWANVPLKRAIAGSASVMWISAIIGASLKVYGLPGHGMLRTDVFSLAAPMAIGAFAGSRLGAGLTHRLRLPHLKLAISAVLAVAGLRLVGII
jgi:hypothetical protein